MPSESRGCRLLLTLCTIHRRTPDWHLANPSMEQWTSSRTKVQVTKTNILSTSKTLNNLENSCGVNFSIKQQLYHEDYKWLPFKNDLFPIKKREKLQQECKKLILSYRAVQNPPVQIRTTAMTIPNDKAKNLTYVRNPLHYTKKLVTLQVLELTIVLAQYYHNKTGY